MDSGGGGGVVHTGSADGDPRPAQSSGEVGFVTCGPRRGLRTVERCAASESVTCWAGAGHCGSASDARGRRSKDSAKRIRHHGPSKVPVRIRWEFVPTSALDSLAIQLRSAGDSVRARAGAYRLPSERDRRGANPLQPTNLLLEVGPILADAVDTLHQLCYSGLQLRDLPALDGVALPELVTFLQQVPIIWILGLSRRR